MSLRVELRLPHGEVLVRIGSRTGPFLPAGSVDFRVSELLFVQLPNNNYRGKSFEDAALVDPVLRALPLWNTPNKNRGDQKGQACCVATFGRGGGGVGEAMPVLTCHE